MKIYGVRIYPQSVKVDTIGGTPIFVHGRVSQNCSDFFYIFRPLAPLWPGHLFANDFVASYADDWKLEDPIPRFRSEFGPGLYGADLKSQLMLLRGEDFLSWGAILNFCEGALLPIFCEPPSYQLLKRIYWGRNFRLTSETWPRRMRAIIHMWDDVYWQLFSSEHSDIEELIRAHAGDPRLKMYFVDFDREYPDPSNEELQAVN